MDRRSGGRLKLVALSVPSIEVAIEPLRVADIDTMANRWERDFDLGQVRKLVAQCPGRSVWAPSSGEVVIVGEWRHRPEIASIVGVRAVRNSRELMRAAANQCRELGVEVLLTVEWNERQQPEFYESIGFELFDSVIPFELHRPRPGPIESASYPLSRISKLDEGTLEGLLDVDHAAFAWLWINSAAEFLTYADTPGVELWGHYLGDSLLSYAGFTCFGGWGHIDRLAVHPDAQRRGLGDELTRLAIHRLQTMGSTTIGLSTQSDNWKSQRLYHQLGFRRSSKNAYRIYGSKFGNR